MAKKKAAVLTIHGMGAQYKNLDADPKVPTYSAGLRDRVRTELAPQKFDPLVGWYEVYWADVLQKRQEEFGKTLKKMNMLGSLRQFVMYNLSDAACYYPIKDDPDSTYDRVHDRVDRALAVAAAECDPGAPLIVAAHSLGGHIMSNYIYDVTKARDTGTPRFDSAFRNLETFRSFFTFGCNIPVFIFSAKKVEPIRYPGKTDGPPGRTWWQNFFDPDDPLGYPLGAIGGGYLKMVQRKELTDFRINSGGLLSSWNPWSHNEYWNDRDVFEPVARELERVLGI